MLDIKLKNIDIQNFNKQKIKDLGKLHYKSMTTPMIKLNNWLEEISLRNNVNFLERKILFVTKN